MTGLFAMPRDEELAAALTDIVESAKLAQELIEQGSPMGRLQEGRMLCLTGLSGTGKTTSIHRAFSRYPELAGHAARDGSSQLASFVAPSPATLRLTGLTAVEAVGYETARDLKENVAWQVLRTQIRNRGIRFLHIDELQHAFQTPNRVEHQKLRDTLEGLMQQPDWPVWRIVSGLPSVADFLREDDQLRRRCTVVRFDSLAFKRDAGNIAGMVKAICAKAQLVPDGLLASGDKPASSDEFVHRLIHAALSQVGIAIEIVQDAAVLALTETSTVLQSRHFAAAYRARSGCEPDANVFTADAWAEIDVRQALYPTVSEPVEEPKKKRRPRDRRDN